VSDRDRAQQWLADRLCSSYAASAKKACPDCLRSAAAILDTPGVEVGTDGVVVDFDSRPVKTRERLIIKLPWEPVKEEK
jgi:hypothetical protein